MMVMLIIILLLVCVVVSGVIYFVSNKEEKIAEQPNSFQTSIITDENQKIEKVDPGYYTIEMELLASSSDGQSFRGKIGNAKNNQYPVFVTIVDEEQNEVLFTSGVIPIGSQIDSFVLGKKLDSGTHDVVLIYHQVSDEESMEEVSTVRVAYSLVVE